MTDVSHPLTDPGSWEERAEDGVAPYLADAGLRRRIRELTGANLELSNLLAGAQVPSVMVDREMRVCRFTRPAERAFGLGAADVGRALPGLELNVEAPLLEESLREVLDGLFLAKQLEVSDRQDRWYALWIRALRDSGRGVEGAVLSLVDVTDRRIGLRALEASRGYGDAIVDAVNNSLIILNRHLKVKRASRVYHALFQDAAADIEGRSIYEVGGGRWNVPTLRRHLSALVAQQTPFAGWEGEFEVPKLGRRTLTVSGSVIPHTDGEDMNFVLAVEDVSVRKQAAEAAVLRRSEARQRDFVANVSHELMTPITAIKGYAESLAAGAVELPGERVKFLQIIEKHADRLTQLVEDLLRLSSYDSGVARHAPEPVSLRGAVLKLTRSLAPMARKRKISVKVDIPERLRVAIDRGELTQVLQNLCGNAIKYNRAKGRVTVTARTVGRRATVTVADTGIGIPKEDLSRVFERFHRAENARLKTSRGNGLGLSIVRSILLHRGCRIWAESEEGKGTVIHFNLPLAPASRPPRRKVTARH